MTWQWPLDAEPLLPDLPGLFGYPRAHDIHTGVDLYCELGTKVLAVEDGEVIGVDWFTGVNAPTWDDKPSTWWNDTHIILVRGESGVVGYGEVSPRVRVGEHVKKGDWIATIDQAVLKTYKGRPMVMLHIEVMTETADKSDWWPPGTPCPPTLRDPLPFLLAAAPGVKFFDMRNNRSKAFRDPNAPEKKSRWSLQYANLMMDWGLPLRDCAVAVIQDERGRVLLLRRSPTARVFPDRLCLPGGKTDPGEIPPDTAVRETVEETGILVKATWCLPIQDTHDVNGTIYRTHPFRVVVMAGTLCEFPTPEHSGYEWFDLSTLEHRLADMAGIATIKILRNLLPGYP